MKDILFKADMIKAIVEGRKTVTRRLDHLKEINLNPDGWELSMWDGKPTQAMNGGFQFIMKPLLAVEGNLKAIKPRYRVGDVVYIKEAWRVGAWNEDNGQIAVDYKIDNYAREEWLDPPEGFNFEKIWIECSDDAEEAGKVYDFEGHYYWKPGESPCRWRTPLFMPEWAARLFIRILDVRAERLQEITEDDAKAEGVTRPPNYSLVPYYREWFKYWWDKINPKYPWSYNDWVFRYEFKLVKEG